MDKRSFRLSCALLLLVYTALVLSYTVLLRPVGFWAAHTAPFWSYRDWFGGNWRTGAQILGNIALLVPFGALLGGCLRAPRVWKSLLAGLLLSCLIETLQYLLMRGQFEFDDLLNNALGAALGGLGWPLLRHWKGARRALPALGAAAVLIAALVCLRGGQYADDYAARHYCFEVERVRAENRQIELSGFGFWVGHEAKSARLNLVSTKTGKKLPLRVAYGLEREDVGAYFGGGAAYTHTGFTAVGEGLNAGEEYELYAAFGWRVPLATGVCLRDGALYRVSEAYYRAPEAAGGELAALLREGTVLVYLPGLPCWIVQRGQTLYWIVKEGYPFEPDGSTRFQYGLWSTQPERQPPEKLHKSLGCADLGGAFEGYELAGDFGPYRVMARALPEEYPVTAVLTGYWSREGWSWKSCFRPIYEFSP